MRGVVIAGLVLAASTAAADVPARLDVAVGANVGVLFPFGIDGIATYRSPTGHVWNADLSWQPSAGWQSYSLGADAQPLRVPLFAGARVRYLQLHPPWSRGFDGSHDHQLGVGLEVGTRFRLGAEGQFVCTAALGAFAIPSGDTELPVLYTLTLGVAHRVWAAR